MRPSLTVFRPVRLAVPALVLAAASARAQRPDTTLEHGASVGVIDVDSTAAPPVGDFSDLLSSRVPGVLVERSSGVTGSGSRIHMRGYDGIFSRTDPLLIVDGVRVDGTTAFSTLDVGVLPSRLNDLDPEDIESIQVLRGPASAALFGGDAAGGVILVTTRRGHSGAPRWHVHTQYGPVAEVTSFPANYLRSGTNAVTGDSLRCTLDLQSMGACIPGALHSWNPLENASPFRLGSHQRHGISVSGGDGALDYYLAGDFDREEGVYTNNDGQRTNLRVNLRGASNERFQWSSTASFVDGTLQLPRNDDWTGPLTGGLLGYAVDDPERHGYFEPLSVLQSTRAKESVHHLTAGFTGEWRPLAWLRSTTTVGVDHVVLDGSQYDSIPALTFGAAQNTTGDYTSLRYDVGTAATASYTFTPSLSASSSVSLAFHDERLQYSSLSTTPQLGSPPKYVSSTDDGVDVSTVGGYVQERVAWRNRLFVALAMHGEKKSGAQVSERLILSPSADASWIISDEPFFPHQTWLTQLRARAAYGRTERAAGILQIGAGPSVVRAREWEEGLDAVLFDHHLDLALTHYDRMTWERIPLLPMDAFFTLPQLGPSRDRGVEMQAHASLLQSHRVAFDVTLASTTHANRVMQGDSAVAIALTADKTQHIHVGYPASGYWQRPILGYEDKNGDGIISRADCPGQPTAIGGPDCEIQLGDTPVFLGSALPTRELSLAPAVTLFQHITLSTLLDYRGGVMRYDQTRRDRCPSLCRAGQDPTTPLADQAASEASLMGSDAGYIEDASFWRLRQVAVTVSLPRHWARGLAARDVRLTIAGRNLGTWTRYPGLDPEINAYPAAPLATAEDVSQPLVRYVTARVDVTW